MKHSTLLCLLKLLTDKKNLQTKKETNGDTCPLVYKCFSTPNLHQESNMDSDFYNDRWL